LFDTVSVCRSKGQGAPVGTVHASSADRIVAARGWRKRYGAGLRQAGVLAAAGLYALDHHLDRLADDHARARRLAEHLAGALPGVVKPESVETNIVVVDLTPVAMDGATFLAAARERGVLAGGLGRRTIRLVTHLDVDDDGIERAGAVLAELLRSGATR
jgi:threonine aldolase